MRYYAAQLQGTAWDNTTTTTSTTTASGLKMNGTSAAARLQRSFVPTLIIAKGGREQVIEC